MTIWVDLGIAATDDLRKIKRAYAARLKAIDPQADPEGFQRLRQAYEAARALASDPRPGRRSHSSQRDSGPPMPATPAAPDPIPECTPPVARDRPSPLTHDASPPGPGAPEPSGPVMDVTPVPLPSPNPGKLAERCVAALMDRLTSQGDAAAADWLRTIAEDEQMLPLAARAAFERKLADALERCEGDVQVANLLATAYACLHLGDVRHPLRRTRLDFVQWAEDAYEGFNAHAELERLAGSREAEQVATVRALIENTHPLWFWVAALYQRRRIRVHRLMEHLEKAYGPMWHRTLDPRQVSRWSATRDWPCIGWLPTILMSLPVFFLIAMAIDGLWRSGVLGAWEPNRVERGMLIAGAGLGVILVVISVQAAAMFAVLGVGRAREGLLRRFPFLVDRRGRRADRVLRGPYRPLRFWWLVFDQPLRRRIHMRIESVAGERAPDGRPVADPQVVAWWWRTRDWPTLRFMTSLILAQPVMGLMLLSAVMIADAGYLDGWPPLSPGPTLGLAITAGAIIVPAIRAVATMVVVGLRRLAGGARALLRRTGV